MSSRILGASWLKSATITAEDTMTGYEAYKMSDGRTSSQAGFAVGASRVVTYEYASGLDITTSSIAVGVAKHNLGTRTANLLIEVSEVAGVWETLLNQAFTSNSPQVFEVTTTLSVWNYVRVTVSDHGGSVYISDLTIGEYVDTTRGQPVGFVVPAYAFRHEVRSNITKGNELAGLTIIKKPKEFKINIEHVDTFTLAPIILKILNIIDDGPFYFKWANTAEDGYDGSVAFCWLKTYPQVRYDGLTTRATTLDCIGFT